VKGEKMRKLGMTFLVISITTFLFLNSATYPMGQYPRVEREDSVDLRGTYTVIFYGGTYSNDPATITILDVEGDDYDFEPFTSEYNYQIKKGIPAELALKESQWFVSRHTDFYTSRLQRITNEKDKIIGYELRPLYHSRRFGRHDILDVYYRMRDKTVSVTVDIKRTIRRRFWDKGFGGG
jgi:hypothetical protein